MQTYLNLSLNSGVAGYNLNVDSIDVMFRGSPKIYSYDASNVGHSNVDTMKQLATSGSGLGTFINQHPEVKKGFTLKS